MATGRVAVGRVLGAHGVRGELRVRPLGDGPEHLLDASEIWLADSQDDARAERFEVRATGSAAGGCVRLTLPGIGDRDAAIASRGRLVLVDVASLEPLPEDEYYWHQLIGCRVEAGDGSPIGRVRELWETGAHDVLVVDAEDGRQHLIPTAREFLREIDLAGQRVVVELIPGLLDPE